jgi:hypothetical protein
LPAAEELAEQCGDSGEEPGGAADDKGFADPAEDVAGCEREWLHDEGAVDLVDPVFVLEQAVWTPEKVRRELCGAVVLAEVEECGR